MTRRIVDTAGWRKEANCLGVDPIVFFPERGEPGAQAKAICSRCVVQEPCLEDALTPPVEFFGVRGGRSERERRVLRRGRIVEVDVA